jgi:hypothetical protein
LYRLVKPIYVKPENGGWRLSSQAFTHPSYFISVDRAASLQERSAILGLYIIGPTAKSNTAAA